MSFNPQSVFLKEQLNHVLNAYCPDCMLLDKKQSMEHPCQKQNLMPKSIYDGIQANADKWIEIANEDRSHAMVLPRSKHLSIE